jgi:hypothetical protein
MRLEDLKQVVNDHQQWQALSRYFESQIEKYHEDMEKQADPVLIYRAQGKVEVLRRLLKLREEVNGAGQRSLF